MREKKEIYMDMVKFSCLSGFLTFLGVGISFSSSSPWNLGISSLYYMGSLLTISPLPYMIANLKRNKINRDRIKMTLDNWEHKNKFELYDRMILNKKLERLSRKKPTYIRRSKKYALVRNYREQYPKTR